MRTPRDLGREALLRSYRAGEWTGWFSAAGVSPPIVRGVVFDSSLAMAEAAAQGAAVALLPSAMSARDLRSGRLVRPFALELDADGHWLTRLKSRRPTAAMRGFRDGLTGRCAAAGGTAAG